MKYSAFLLLIFFCISCSSKKSPRQTVLTPNNLPTQLFEIDPAIENTIRTKKGATVRFPANAFKLNGSGKVTVEIKEAYSMKDILLAGLTTETNGQPLSSGGMIYINAQQNNKDIDLEKTANVSTPAFNYDEDMQLYKGEVGSDSTINWVEPKPLDSNPNRMIEAGKAMFINNCSSCHIIDKPSSGPPLYDILNRVPSKEWLYAYTRNWESAYSYKDSTSNHYCAYAGCLVKYSSTTMNKFPALTNRDLDALYGYIQYESARTTAPWSEGTSPDRCVRCLETGRNYSVMYQDADWKAGDTLGGTTVTAQYNLPGDTSIKPVDIAPYEASTLEYTFSIQSFGWFNIDALYDVTGVTQCSLKVNVQHTGNVKDMDVQVYLVIPSRKVFMNADKVENGSWIFNKEENKIPLLPGDAAHIIAFVEQNGKMLYGDKPFIIQQDNSIALSLSVTSKEAFKIDLGRLGMNSTLPAEEETANNTTNSDGSANPQPAEQPVQQPGVQPNTPDTAKRNVVTFGQRRYVVVDTIWRDCGCPATRPATAPVRNIPLR